MGILLISLLTLVLILISLFVIMIVLMQRTSQSGGMGAALGGGAAESAFGSETNNILTKGTIYGIIAFFLVALGLYLLYQAQISEKAPEVDPALLAVEEGATESETAEKIVVPLESADGTAGADELSVGEAVDAAADGLAESLASGGDETAPATDAPVESPKN